MKIAHAAAKAGATSGFTAGLSAAPIIARVTKCCGDSSTHSHAHGYSCANASCPACMRGIVVEGWMLTPPEIEHDDIASPHRRVAARDPIPDLPPPRFS